MDPKVAEAYLTHIGATKDSTLDELVTAHCASFYYHNESILSECILFKPNPEDRKVAPVGAVDTFLPLKNRGGYCFQNNDQLMNALLHLGHDVTRHEAVVMAGHSLNEEKFLGGKLVSFHSVLMVHVTDADGKKTSKIVDVGFSYQSPLASFPYLPDGTIHHVFGDQYRVIPVDSSEWKQLEMFWQGAWFALYRFSVDPISFEKVVALNENMFFEAKVPVPIRDNLYFLARLTPEARKVISFYKYPEFEKCAWFKIAKEGKYVEEVD